MSRLSKGFGFWVGLKLRNAIKRDVQTMGIYSSIATVDLLDRVSALESLADVMNEKISALATSLSIAELHLDTLQKTTSGSPTSETKSPETASPSTESCTPLPDATKKVILH